MVELPTTSDFHRIVIESTALVDVRAPVEFKAGAFPMAVNLPILDDEDRHQVGLCYKQKGKEAAFALAYQRVSGTVREERVAAWKTFHAQHPEMIFYCFRGGMRSTTAQQWFGEQTGQTVLRLEGGYKAFRRYLLGMLNPEKVKATPVILGGRTGTGKTLLLRKLENSIDLENLANHRGSTFGGFLVPQPSQIDFENRLACALIQHNHQGHHHLILEDEGSYIGARYIPHDLVPFFRRESMILLECSIAERLEITFKEYVVDAQEEFERAHGPEEGDSKWLAHMLSRLHRIRKRLGGERLKRVVHLLDEAWIGQRKSGDLSLHKRWIELLLTEYYDPMYDYQIEKSGRSIDFQGNSEEVLEYLKSLEHSSSA